MKQHFLGVKTRFIITLLSVVFLGNGGLAGESAEKPFFEYHKADIDSISRPSECTALSPLLRSGAESGRDPSESSAPELFLTPSYLKRGLARDILADQVAIWQSPAKIRKKDFLWLLPFGLGTAAIVPHDQEISQSLRGRFEGGSLKFSRAGGVMSLATSATLFGIGHFYQKAKLQETGLLGIRAFSSTWLTVQILKISTNRERPVEDGVEQEGKFWGGGDSFPSGHSAEGWALATVIAKQYPKHPWIRFGAYAFAAGISFSRVSGQKHFPSDVVVGALIGNLIGRHAVESWKKKRERLLLEIRNQSHPTGNIR